MGIGVRSFVVDDDGSVNRVAWQRMVRLFQGKPTVEFAERSGRPIRCAIVFLEFQNRRPRRILRTEFNILHLDDQGALDPEAQSQQLRLIGQCLDCAAPRATAAGNLLDSRPRLARKQLRDKFEWTPSEDVLEVIFRRCL